MNWQINVENLMNAEGADESQKAFAELLIERAESLFAMQSAYELWK